MHGKSHSQSGFGRPCWGIVTSSKHWGFYILPATLPTPRSLTLGAKPVSMDSFGDQWFDRLSEVGHPRTQQSMERWGRGGPCLYLVPSPIPASVPHGRMTKRLSLPRLSGLPLPMLLPHKRDPRMSLARSHRGNLLLVA